MNDENYNPSFTTPLGELEPMFRQWKSQQAPTDPGRNYDYRGAFQNEFMGGNTRDPLTGHWRDTYKQPNHPTFSVESQYASAYPERAGTWQGNTYQKPSGNEWFDNYFGQGISPIDVLHSFSPPPPNPTPTPQASPTALPSPPTQPPWLSQKHKPSLGNVWPGMMASIGEAGSQLAGMSKEDKAKMAISLLIGREGEVPFPKGNNFVPEHVWNSWKPVKSGDVAGVNAGGIEMISPFRKDPAGNHYEAIGSQVLNNEATGERTTHVIAKQVPIPGEAAAFDEGPATSKEIQDMKAYMEALKNKPKMQPEENFPNWNESHGVKEAKFDDVGHVDTLREYATRNNLSAEQYHKLLDLSLASNPYKSGPIEGVPTKEIPQDAPPPPKTDWGNLNDPKYYDRSMSGPLVGQQWADIYATPDVEFTVPPKNPNDPYLDPKYDPDLQIWFRTNYGKTGEPIDPTTGEPFKAPEGDAKYGPEGPQWGFGAAKEDFLSAAGEELPPPETGFKWHMPGEQSRWGYKPPPEDDLPLPPLPRF